MKDKDELVFECASDNRDERANLNPLLMLDESPDDRLEGKLT